VSFALSNRRLKERVCPFSVRFRLYLHMQQAIMGMMIIIGIKVVAAPISRSLSVRPSTKSSKLIGSFICSIP